FADIGTLRQTQRDAQLQPATVGPLPAITLPRMRRDDRWSFAAAAKLATPADLKRALGAERKRVAPFLRDLAPKLPSLRHRQVLSQFDWRLAPRDTLGAYANASAGRGTWQKVSV